MSRELAGVRAHDVPAGLLEFLPRILVCLTDSIGRPVGFPIGVLSRNEDVADGWGGSEAFLCELALGGDEFVDDLALRHQ